MSTELTVSRLDDSLFSKELAPHYMQLAGKLASSALVPKCFQGKPQDLFICWAMGYQIGMSPEQAMQCIAVINGRACMWGDEMLALCMVHPDFEDIIEQPILKGDTVIGYTCTIKRKGQTPKLNSFTLDMAKKAGLLGKAGTWTTSTERMLKLRARGFSLRDAFPDALKGIKPREEVEDYIDVEYKVVEGSRTEFLKKDILHKEDNEINNAHVDLVANEACKLPELAANQNIQQPGLDIIGVQEDPLLTESQDVSAITPEQAKMIFKLIDQTGFSQERLDKALQYYEVGTISKLDSKSADHFIAQLSKL